MIAYKLTTAEMQTFGGCTWTPGEWQRTWGREELCTEGWLHYYDDPLIAVFLDPIFGNFGPTARLWEAEAEGRIKMYGRPPFVLTYGCTRLRLVREIPLPELTMEQRVEAAIRIAQYVVGDDCPVWSAWAEAWLSGADRSAKATTKAEAETARVATCAPWNAAWAALKADAEAAAEAAAWAEAEAAGRPLPNLAMLLREIVGRGKP